MQLVLASKFSYWNEFSLKVWNVAEAWLILEEHDCPTL